MASCVGLWPTHVDQDWGPAGVQLVLYDIDVHPHNCGTGQQFTSQAVPAHWSAGTWRPVVRSFPPMLIANPDAQRPQPPGPGFQPQAC